jgi:hypothetical protein
MRKRSLSHVGRYALQDRCYAFGDDVAARGKKLYQFVVLFVNERLARFDAMVTLDVMKAANSILALT